VADTDRTMPDVIDATVLPPDEVQRRTDEDVLNNGRAFVLKRQPPPLVEAAEYARRCGIDMGADGGGVCLVVVSRHARAADVERVRRRFEAVSLLSGMKHVVVLDPDHGKIAGATGQVFMDDQPFEPHAIDALALKPRTMDRGPDATQGALTPVKLTPAETRVARKLAGPWHDDKQWKHAKKGRRR